MTLKTIIKECGNGLRFDSQVHKYANFVYDDIRFVDRGSGNDGNDGADWDHAKKSINSAVDEFNSGARDANRGEHCAIVFRGRLTGGNAFSATEGQQTIDISGVHLLGGGAFYGDGGGWESSYVTNSQNTPSTAIFSGTGVTRAGLILSNDDIRVSGLKFYCSDETNAMVHVGVHDRDITNDSSQSGRNCLIENNTFQGDLDGTVMIDGVVLDGGESCSVLSNRFYYCGNAIAHGGGGERYATKNIIENNKIFSCKVGVKGCNATSRENIVQDNTICAKGQYGWAITYGIDAANSSTDSFYIGNVVGHGTESTAFNYGTGNFWINNYITTGGGTLANPDS